MAALLLLVLHMACAECMPDSSVLRAAHVVSKRLGDVQGLVSPCVRCHSC